MTPDVTVIIPIYNVAAFLEECLQSVLALPPSWQIILVDDGSTDQSGEIAQKFSQQWSERFTLLYQDNQGLSGARNTGLNHALGQYVVFLDSDDWVDASKLILAVKEVIAQDLDVAMFFIQEVKSESVKLIPKPSRVKRATEAMLNGKQWFLTFLKARAFFPTAWAYISKRSLWEGGNNHPPIRFEEGLVFEDVECTPRLLLRAKRVSFIPIAYYHYRIRSGSISTSEASIAKRLDAIKVADSLYHTFAQHELLKESACRRLIYTMYIRAYRTLCRLSPRTHVYRVGLESLYTPVHRRQFRWSVSSWKGRWNWLLSSISFQCYKAFRLDKRKSW